MTLMFVQKVPFDSKELWQLTDFAEKRGQTVAELLSDLGKQLLAGKVPPKPPEPEPEPKPVEPTFEELCVQVQVLYGKGLADNEIAKRLNRSPAWAQRTRVRLGLPSRNRGRRTHEEIARAREALEELDNNAAESAESS
jgi:hypothetical protein